MPSKLGCLSLTLADVPEDDSWLSADERAQLSRFRIAKRRSDWRLGRWTAKQATSLYLCRDSASLSGLEIRAAPDGAPEAFIEDRPAPVSLSISHSAGRSLCTVGDRPDSVGCDLEEIAPRDESLVGDYFTSEEGRLIAHAPLGERQLYITLIWCAKESALKSLRQGLRRDTRSVVVTFSEAGREEAWHPFAARCLESSRTFYGRWRVSAGFVQAVTSVFPGIPHDLRA